LKCTLGSASVEEVVGSYEVLQDISVGNGFNICEDQDSEDKLTHIRKWNSIESQK